LDTIIQYLNSENSTYHHTSRLSTDRHTVDQKTKFFKRGVLSLLHAIASTIFFLSLKEVRSRSCFKEPS
jgi:hypothetical protein